MTEEQLGSYFYSPTLSDDKSCYSSMLSQISTSSHNRAVPGCWHGGRMRQWSGPYLDKCWKKDPILVCCGREDRKSAEGQSFAKDAEGALARRALCFFIMRHLLLLFRRWDPVGKYSLEMPTVSVSWGIQPFYSRFSQEFRIKYASCQPKAGRRNAQEQFHLIAVASARKWRRNHCSYFGYTFFDGIFFSPQNEITFLYKPIKRSWPSLKAMKTISMPIII